MTKTYLGLFFMGQPLLGWDVEGLRMETPDLRP